MSAIDLHVRHALEKYLVRIAGQLKNGQEQKITDYMSEITDQIGRMKDETTTLLDGFSKIADLRDREDVIASLLLIRDQLDQATQQLKKWNDERTIFIEKFTDLYQEYQKNIPLHFVSFDDALMLIRNMDDIEIRRGGQTFSVSPSKIGEKQLQNIYQSLPWKDYQGLKDFPLVNLEALFKDNYKKEQQRMREFLLTELSEIFEAIRRTNMTSSSLIDEVVDRAHEFGIEFEINIEMPTFEDDLMFGQYINAVEEGDRDTLLTLGIELFPDVNFYELSTDEIIDYLGKNYFNRE